MKSTTTPLVAGRVAEAPGSGHPIRPGARIPRLDFFRAFSAGIVILYHSGYDAINAGFGVLTFFVISGFLITHLLIREKEATGNISFRNFYIRRSLRIFPPFYVYWILAIAALLLRHAKIIWPQAICSLFYINNYYQGLHHYPDSLFSHTWSLGVEEQFYLLWPAAFVFFRNRLENLTRVLLFLIPALWIYRGFLYSHGVSESYIYTSFETRIDAILVGCLFALLLHLGIGARLLAELRRPHYLPITVALLLMSVMIGDQRIVGYRDLIGFALNPVLVILLIQQLIETRSTDWMDSRLFVYLGAISYSTYLYQQIVIAAVRVSPLKNISKPLFSCACLLGTWFVASLSYRFVEKPIFRLKERFTARSVRPDREHAPVLESGD